MSTDLVLYVVHFRADDGHDGLGVDDYFDSVVKLDDFIELSHAFLVDVVHDVGQSIASLFAQADLESDLD